MHTWSKNDAARINNKIYRVLSVTRDNLPTVMIDRHEVMAEHQDSWTHVGRYTWSFNPFTPGEPFWKFQPAGVGDEE